MKEQFDTTVIINDGSYVYVHDAYSGTISFENTTTREIGLYNTIEGEARSTDTLIREVSSLTEYVDFPVYKILVIADGEYLRNHTEAIVSPFKDTTNFSSSSPNFLEFTHKNVDKGLTIENEISKLGYDIKSMIAFGDGRNDISMLTTVEIGVAMKNADKQVFPVADIVTETNDNEGIAVVLKDFIL